ncbi:hypothetical protein GCM10009639_47610 [Kitasatospora putterlickiae]|uniref:Uncharacterized protein n=1 Tax=Kitasatospora putterlickiae TaxID=221725 RepID=A0ABP4IZD2_9ACTN
MTSRRILAALALAAAALSGWITANTFNEPAPADAAQVTAFNDGWTDAMADACQQGSAYACKWLSTTR